MTAGEVQRLDRAPVMADVAKLAGVSHQTVSRVVNGQTNLRPDTRDRVLEAIRQLGYRPNTAARALVTKRSATIGVIGSKSGYWGPSSVHRSVQAAARATGYFVSSVNLADVTRAELQGAVDHLRAQAVEGIILIAAHDEALEVARAQETGPVPLVVVEGDLSQARWTAGVDQVGGSRQATRHLLDLGHTRVGYLAGPMNWTESRARLQGYEEAMEAAGLVPLRPLAGEWSAASGYQAGVHLAAQRVRDVEAGLEPVSAVVVANDQMAIGVLRALTEAGCAVPGDVSVVGFDDIPEAPYLIPPLTTVRQDFVALGRRAITVLRAAMAGEAEDGRFGLIVPELVVRASSGPPPGPQMCPPLCRREERVDE